MLQSKVNFTCLSELCIKIQTNSFSVFFFLLEINFYLQEILTQLRTIFDLVIEFQAAQNNFYSSATEELDLRVHYEKAQEQRSREVYLSKI